MIRYTKNARQYLSRHLHFKKSDGNRKAINAGKKAMKLSVFVKKVPNARLSKFFKTRILPFVNDCLKNKNNRLP
jgi:hypothetical protein